ncbi:hypothetical protein ACHQM5_011499 [Ranunculus cassubicifolius]
MVTQPCPTKFPQWEISAWVVPNRKMQAKKQVADVTEEALVNNSIFPAEIMEKIFQSLHSGGNIRFRLATKSFISMIPPVRSFNPQILSSTQDLPWLVSFPNSTEKICYFYHPIYTNVYTTNFSRLRDSIIRHAKFGWLLMSVGRRCLFFFNPLTGETVQLPTGYPPYGTFINISFSSPPTSTDCVVFGHMSCGENFAHMSVYRKSQNRWCNHSFLNTGYTFIPSDCNQVYRDGVFYSLSKDGKLGVFNPNESNEEDMWKVYTNLSVPSVRLSTTSLICGDSTRSFIVERDSEILCVFVGCIGDPVHVYKLDQSKETKKWIRVESLGDRVMFLSHTTSILVPAVLKGTENRIYLPRFKKNSSVFYSLKSGKYHSFGDQDSRADWINTSEHWNCTWFQIPSATHPS